MEWGEHVAREQERYRDGAARVPELDDPDARQKQLTRMANAAGGAGLALLMQGRDGEATEWFSLAAGRYRESFADAPPGKLGTADRRHEESAPRRRLGGRRGCRRVGAVGGRCCGGVPDRQVRGLPCVADTGARPRGALSRGRPAHPRWFSHRCRGRACDDLRPGRRRVHTRRRGGARVVRDAGRVPRGHPGGRHRHRAADAGGAARPWRPSSSPRYCPSSSPAAARSSTTTVSPSFERTRLAGVVRARRLAERAARGVRLALAGRQEEHRPAVLEGRDGQGDPLDVRLEARVGRHDQAIADLQRGRVREERSGVPVGAEPVQDQVEGHAAQVLFVGGRGLLGVVFSPDPVDGRRSPLQPVEQGVLHEEVVRPRIVRRDAALVAPPHLGLAPVGLELGGQLVRAPWALTAGEDDVPAGTRRFREPLRDEARRRLRIGDDFQPDAHSSPAASSRERSIAA